MSISVSKKYTDFLLFNSTIKLKISSRHFLALPAHVGAIGESRKYPTSTEIFVNYAIPSFNPH